MEDSEAASALENGSAGDTEEEYPVGEPVATDEEGILKKIHLPSGGTARIIDAKARAHFKARRYARDQEGDTETNYMTALIGEIVTIDEENIRAPDVPDLDLMDFMAIQSALDDLIRPTSADAL